MIRGRVRFHEALEDLMVDIDTIRSHPDNPRNGDVDAIVESIEINGFIAPIIAQRSSGHILAGNHRYYALHQLGSDVAPVVWVDVDDTQARRYLLADNRTSDLGRYDDAALLDLLSGLEADNAGLVGTGYDEEFLDNLRHIVDISPEPGDHASWPTLSIQVHPRIKNAFYETTEPAHGDAERLELLLRKAGWEE